MKIFTRYLQHEEVIEKHDEIPDNLREQPYADQDQRLERRKTSSDSTRGLTSRYVYVEGTYFLRTSLGIDLTGLF